MSNARMFGTSRHHLNVMPLLLTPGFAAIGYAVHGPRGAWCAVAAWLAIMLGATVSCALHAWRSAHEAHSASGRQPFDYDVKGARR
jgi:hypothetical protein